MTTAFGRIDDFIDRFVDDLGGSADEANVVVQRYLDLHDAPFLNFLRAHKPIVATKAYAVVTRYDDALAVLGDDEHFSVELYRPRMEEIAGTFVLGTDDPARYERDETVLRGAVKREDMERLAEIARRTAEEAVVTAGKTGWLDVVTDLAERVELASIREYFGYEGPDDATLIAWGRVLFDEIFVNVRNEKDLHDRAMIAAAGIRAHLGAAIAARKNTGEARDDFIGRLLSSQGTEPSFSDEEIRNNVIGLIVGWVPTTASAVALAIDELLGRPEELARAQEAARSGDVDGVGAYMFEALRFQPQNSGVLRKCLTDYALAAGTDRETMLHAGSIVYIATQSAMMDEDTLDEPESFRVDRPWEHYLHFGYGRHTCFGEQINRVQIPAMAAVLLAQQNLRRAPGRAGKLSWDGLHPIGLDVAFDPA